jgi:phosphatidylglycerol:prolipoprotein diacylglycerol transferase
MWPVLIDLGIRELPLVGRVHLFLPTYGVLFAAGTVLAWWWFVRRARALAVPDEQTFNLSFYSLLAGIVGAKLTLVLLDWRDYWRHPGELLGVVRSAGVLLGGVIAGALVFVVYARRHALPLFRLADAVAAPLALGQAVGRIGCLAAGCCWGAPADPLKHWTIRFHDAVAHEQTGVPLDVPLVPVQLYQMLHDLALVALLAWLGRRRLRPDGTLFWIYVLVYGVGRGILEFWRGDAQRGLYFVEALQQTPLQRGLSTSQLLGAAGIVLAAVMLVVRRRRAGRGAVVERAST